MDAERWLRLSPLLDALLDLPPAGRNLVLLGDPQQLEQPRKGIHPDGVSTSALQHMLGDNVATIPPERGVFLDTTWRLCPAIASFTSTSVIL